MSDALDRERSVRPRATNSTSERVALRIGAAINETDAGRAIQNIFLRGVGYVWMRAILSRHMLIEGLDQFRTLNPDRGVILVCNHRSFFDFYATTVALFAGPSPWVERLSFPVRADFFYQRPLGILTNLLAGAAVMYPPFFRERSRMRQNRETVLALSEFLQRPGALVGFHPEGTRNKTADPYSLLPMQPGAGEIALRSGALVVPVFIGGLSNSLPAEIRRRFSGKARRDPCICVLGAPLDLTAFTGVPTGPSAYKRAADHMGEAILALAPRERSLRAEAADGFIADRDGRWLGNRPVSRFYAFR